MKTDLELLELAAKAAGLRHVCYDGKLGLQLVDEIGRHTGTWNPLADDGDALRLACTLCIDLRHGPSFVAACGIGCWEEVEPSGGETRAAVMRRAITQAAAALGSSMPNA